MKRARRPDVSVTRWGLVLYQFRPRTRRARLWVREHIARIDRRRNGSFVAENRCARDIADGMAADGLQLVFCRVPAPRASDRAQRAPEGRLTAAWVLVERRREALEALVERLAQGVQVQQVRHARPALTRCEWCGHYIAQRPSRRRTPRRFHGHRCQHVSERCALLVNAYVRCGDVGANAELERLIASTQWAAEGLVPPALAKAVARLDS